MKDEWNVKFKIFPNEMRMVAKLINFYRNEIKLKLK